VGLSYTKSLRKTELSMYLMKRKGGMSRMMEKPKCTAQSAAKIYMIYFQTGSAIGGVEHE